MAVEPVDNTPPVDGSSAPGGPPGTSGKPEVTSSTTIKSLEELKEISPEIYEGTLMALANEMIKEMDKHQKELKKKMREMSNPQ